MAIYARAGKDIYSNRQRLLKMSNEQSGSHITTIDNPFHASKTTEISFVSEAVDKTTEGGAFDAAMPGDRLSKPSPVAKTPYSVTVSTGPGSQFDTENGFSGTHNGHNDFEMSPTVRFPASELPRPAVQAQAHRSASQTDNANWAYAKVAVLFFVALMVTWIPSSANRVYSYVHPGQISPGLEYASAFVLPLQGFWNGLIYATTSIPACKSFWREITGRKVFKAKPLRRVSTFAPTNDTMRGPPGSRSGMFTEIDSISSMESRPHSKSSKLGHN